MSYLRLTSAIRELVRARDNRDAPQITRWADKVSRLTTELLRESLEDAKHIQDFRADAEKCGWVNDEGVDYLLDVDFRELPKCTAVWPDGMVSR